MENFKIKRSRFMYILEAAFEYLISILVAGSFLATLTKELGFSDSLTGILSSIISLGCLFQLTSVTMRKRQVKGIVVTLSILNQLLFMLLYVVPLSNLNGQTKTVLFVVFIIFAYIIYNFAHPKKINWLMSLVDDKKRGNFTANKEIVSLILGMAFSFIMGAAVDHFAEMGQKRIAFTICAAVILALMFLHTLTLLFTVEKVGTPPEKKKITENLKEVLKNKKFLSVTFVFILYYVSNYLSVPFYGIYKINELGFSLKFVSVLTIITSVTRVPDFKSLGEICR